MAYSACKISKEKKVKIIKSILRKDTIMIQYLKIKKMNYMKEREKMKQFLQEKRIVVVSVIFAVMFFALLQSRCRPIQNLLRKGDCLLCMMFLDGQLIRIPCHGTERRQGIRRIADCIRDGDIIVDLIQ